MKRTITIKSDRKRLATDETQTHLQTNTSDK